MNPDPVIRDERSPVMRDERGWWFYDETWADLLYGPYPSEPEARRALSVYFHWLETGEVPEGAEDVKFPCPPCEDC